MDWPPVKVIIPTYNRPEILARTIQLLNENLHYSGELHYWIGNDGDDECELARGQITARRTVNIIPGPRKQGTPKGLGGNLNRLLRLSGTFFLQMDDDHHLVLPLNLDPHVRELAAYSMACWIRLMGVSSHPYVADLRGHYWYVSWDSPFLYIPSNRPHIKHIWFHEYFGYYPEKCMLGVTEEAFCHQCVDKHRDDPRDGEPMVLIPLNSQSESAWQHVGQSWQTQGE